jgi:hypothetical protein
MTPTPEEIATAVRVLGSSTIQYFPADKATRVLIMHELERLVPTKSALDWIVEQFVRHIGQWYSVKELRGLLCAHCNPLDGIEVPCTIPGYSGDDAEQHWFEKQSANTNRKLTERRLISAPEDPEENAKLEADIEALGRRIKLQNAKRAARPVRDIDVKTPGYRAR